MDKNLSKTEEAALLLSDGMSKAEIEVHLAIANCGFRSTVTGRFG